MENIAYILQKTIMVTDLHAGTGRTEPAPTVQPRISVVIWGVKNLLGSIETLQQFVLSVLKALVQTGDTLLDQRPHHIVVEQTWDKQRDRWVNQTDRLDLGGFSSPGSDLWSVLLIRSDTCCRYSRAYTTTGSLSFSSSGAKDDERKSSQSTAGARTWKIHTWRLL